METIMMETMTLDDIHAALKAANLEIAALHSLGTLSPAERNYLFELKVQRDSLKDELKARARQVGVSTTNHAFAWSPVAQVRELRSGRRQSIYGSKI